MAIWYSAGTVTVASNSASVTAVGTAFVANVQPGDAFHGPDGRVYEIAAVTADTQLTLARPYTGVGAAGQPYQVQPTIGPTVGAVRQVLDLIGRYSVIADGPGAGRFGDGTAAEPGIRFDADQDTGIFRRFAGVLGISSNGIPVADFGPTPGLIAGAGSVAVDLIGRQGDSASYMRFVDAGRTAVTSFVAFDPTVGLLLTATSGSVRLAAAAGAAAFIRVGDADRIFISETTIRPSTNNAMSLGAPGLGWSQVYANNGSIQTSDERLKDWRGGLTDDELAAAREIAGTIGAYRWLAEVDSKGDAARLHVGVKAQATADVFRHHGLDPYRYGINCHDEWVTVPAVAGTAAKPPTPEVREGGRVVSLADPGMPAQPGTAAIAGGDRYSIRYEELTMFLLAAMAADASAARDRITALEGRMAVLAASA